MDLKSDEVGEQRVFEIHPAPIASEATVPENMYAAGESKLVWSRPSPDHFGASLPTADRLPAGLYRTMATNNGHFFVKVRYDNDAIIKLPGTASEQIMQEIVAFWALHDEFKKRGLVHKRGVLMVGPQGSGKTATISQLIDLIINEHDGVAVYLDHPSIAASCLQMIRRIEPGRPVVCILEDLDALIQKYGESEYLALLDGESQIDHVVFVGTTNYPEKLDKRITDRPSRFDLVIEVPVPTREARATFIRAKEPNVSDADLNVWLKMTDGYSIAHLREFLILVAIFKKTVGEAKARLDGMRESRRSSDKLDDGLKTGAGFTSGLERRKPKLIAE